MYDPIPGYDAWKLASPPDTPDDECRLCHHRADLDEESLLCGTCHEHETADAVDGLFDGFIDLLIDAGWVAK